MKFVTAQLSYFFRLPEAQRNLRTLAKLIGVLVVLTAVYTGIFLLLSAWEGQEHSIVSAFYWVVVTMTTLGFGDITLESDPGRLFSVLVITSGVLFLLVILPFTFIQFFYAPWLEAQRHSRAPRQLSESARNHVILAYYDPVAITLIDQLKSYGREYVVIEPELQRAVEFNDNGIRAMVGDPQDLDTFRRARADQAALVVANGDDYQNTNIAFSVRELSESVNIVAKVRDPDSIDVLELAGATHLIQLAEMLGRSLARRTLGGEVRANVIGQFGDLLIAEAPAAGTPLQGKTLIEMRIREVTGVNVVGLWERGQFQIPGPETVIHPTTVLVLAGTAEEFDRFDELFCIYNVSDAPVLILGGGRVGRAAAKTLEEREIDYRIVEKNPDRVRDPARYIIGSAAELAILEEAGIQEAPSTIVTTNDDATNTYLTIYCRRLRPDMQIIARTTLERNVSTLHRAGADFVMSYASMGANAVFNVLERDDVVMLAEGLDVFRYPVPPKLAGTTLVESNIRERTGCSVVAVESDGIMQPSPDPAAPLPEEGVLILIGTTEGERQFVKTFTS